MKWKSMRDVCIPIHQDVGIFVPNLESIISIAGETSES